MPFLVTRYSIYPKLGVDKQLIIAPYTLYSFLVGGFLSLAWCITLLLFILRTQIPNLSAFPEIDVTSKVVEENKIYGGLEISPLAKLLSAVTNSGSIEILKTLRPERFYVYVLRKRGPVVLTTSRAGFPLSSRGGRQDSVGSFGVVNDD